MKDIVKTVFVVGVLAVLIVGVSGCTNSTNMTSSGQNQAAAYAQALSNHYQSFFGPNETLVSAKVTENGTDGAMLSTTSKNTTPGLFAQNGTTTSVSLNIKQFSTVDEATKFYNDMSVGYTPANTGGKNLGGNQTLNVTLSWPYKAYYDVKGRDATTNSTAVKLKNLTDVNLVMQQDEFVTFGTASFTFT